MAPSARAPFLVDDRISLEVSQVQIYLKEFLIKFRNATPVDVLEAVPLYGNGQRDVPNGQRTVNAKVNARSTQRFHIVSI